MVTTSGCQIQFAERNAILWLERFFGAPDRAGLLPQKVCRWLETDLKKATAKSLCAKHLDAQLFVRRHRPHPRDAVPLLLEIVKHRDGESCRKHHALTRRENEVLYWLGYGKSNREIAEILDLAPRTINKHLERIYPKLGVENRTAAAHFAPQIHPLKK